MCKQESDKTILESFGVYMLSGSIDPETIDPIVDSIILENSLQRLDKIVLIITSEGGDVPYAFKLIDTMRMSNIPIVAIGMGEIYSSAFMIFISAHERILTENVSIMCHQFSMSFGDSVKEHEMIAYNTETKNIKDRMVRLIKRFSKLTPRQISKTFFGPSDFWMTAEEMVKFELADKIATDFTWLPKAQYQQEPLNEEVVDK